MTPIQDFGEKIGGARKDLWQHRGLNSADLAEMTDVERSTLVKKENVWIKPNWIKLISEGTPQSVAYWQSKMRQALPPKPNRTDPDTQSKYVDAIQSIRDAVMAVKTPAEIDSFYDNVMCKQFLRVENTYYRSVVSRFSGIVNEKFIGVSRSNQYRMAREARDKLFGIPKDQQAYTAAKNDLSVYFYDGEDVTVAPDKYLPANTLVTVDTGSGFGKTYCTIRKGNPGADPAEWKLNTYFVLQERPLKTIAINFESKQDALDYIEAYARDAQQKANEKRLAHGKAGNKRKQAFVPPQLKHIKRTGPDYRRYHHANSNLFLNELKFRGGEFGNWLNGDDRQASLDMAYDALRDLSRTLHIRPEDVSLGGSLAIAFGARGRGGANAGAAHYEAARQVINLTKMTGAGCLAHEWGHALDHAIGRSYGFTGLASEQKSYQLPPVVRNLLKTMKYKTVTVSQEVNAREKAPEIERCKKSMVDWIDSEKPSNLSPDLEKKWNATVEQILSSASSFTGDEYMPGTIGKASTKPELELLSQIRKAAVSHGLSKKVKQQVVLWAEKLKPLEAELLAGKPVERSVETDFYKGSQAFDKLFSRSAHGYWSSNCEMFARAFDCYISDKLKDAGVRSDYLSGHANSFVIPNHDGNGAAAIPLGEEREVIHQAFDKLLSGLKERGILHDFTETLVQAQPTSRVSAPQERAVPSMSRVHSAGNDQPVRYEQLSFEGMFQAGDVHSQEHAHASPHTPSRDRTR